MLRQEIPSRYIYPNPASSFLGLHMSDHKCDTMFDNLPFTHSITTRASLYIAQYFSSKAAVVKSETPHTLATPPLVKEKAEKGT